MKTLQDLKEKGGVLFARNTNFVFKIESSYPRTREAILGTRDNSLFASHSVSFLALLITYIA